eukprot:TRINITY_DN22035_c0_g1_i1.p1 TRINITY_DN22035_c0_g1~~TRINITY_DN22035_c0_g1_i1.p1  ORF type:complete len:212 (-),score=19.84 TRINITY_DN22035_c0_g1_i1:56-691(-)
MEEDRGLNSGGISDLTRRFNNIYGLALLFLLLGSISLILTLTLPDGLRPTPSEHEYNTIPAVTVPVGETRTAGGKVEPGQQYNLKLDQYGTPTVLQICIVSGNIRGFVREGDIASASDFGVGTCEGGSTFVDLCPPYVPVYVGLESTTSQTETFSLRITAAPISDDSCSAAMVEKQIVFSIFLILTICLCCAAISAIIYARMLGRHRYRFI